MANAPFDIPRSQYAYARGKQLASIVCGGAAHKASVEEYTEAEQFYALDALVSQLQFTFCDALINIGVSPNVRSLNAAITVLMSASARRAEQQIQYLLSVGADVSLRNSTNGFNGLI